MTWRTQVAGFERVAADDEETAALDPTFALPAVQGWTIEELERRIGVAGNRVLDVGCGTGLLLETLAGRGHEVVGVEPSPAMRAEAAHRRPWLTVLEGDLDAIPLPDEAVDGVVTTYAISHLDRDEKPAALGELVRVVRPGGAVVIADVGVASTGALDEVVAALRAGDREGQLPYYADGHALEIDVWEPWLRARLHDLVVARLSALAWGLSGRR